MTDFDVLEKLLSSQFIHGYMFNETLKGRAVIVTVESEEAYHSSLYSVDNITIGRPGLEVEMISARRFREVLIPKKNEFKLIDIDSFSRPVLLKKWLKK
jgi:hypothetical protein